MLFGTREDFGIEAEVEPDLVPPSQVWGRMCVWCRGEALGRLSEPYCSLAHAVESFAWIRDHLDALWDERLDGLDGSAAFRFLDAAVYGDDGRTMEEISADYDRFGKFDFLTNWGEQFDPFKAFVINPGGADLVIVYQRPDDSLGSAAVTKRAFVEAANGVERWLVEQERRLQSKDLTPKRGGAGA